MYRNTEHVSCATINEKKVKQFNKKLYNIKY